MVARTDFVFRADFLDMLESLEDLHGKAKRWTRCYCGEREASSGNRTSNVTIREGCLMFSSDLMDCH